MSKHHHDTETKASPAPRYWLSLDQVEKPASFDAGGEFSSTPVREGFENDGLERRDFLKIMGASALMASLAGCTRRPVQKIVPYVNNPEEITPGVPNFYSSACPETGYGLVIKTREGRPIKVDGNADHPVNRGALHARGQAFIHDLYDPDRLRTPRMSGKDSDWSSVDDAVKKALAAAGKGGVALLTGTMLSPTLRGLVGRLGIRHVMMDSLLADDVLEGQEASYGTRVFPRYRIDKANVIVSIDADFLDTWGSCVEYTHQYGQRRKLDKGVLNKLIAFESMMCLTGQNADERYAIRPQDQLWVALGLAVEVARLLGKSQPELSGVSLHEVAERTGIKAEVFTTTAKELVQNRGRSLVLAGGNVAKGAHSLSLQIIINFLNSALGNEGETVDGTLSPSNQFQGSLADLVRLLADMKSGAVKVLIIEGINPAYLLPVALGFMDAAAKVPHVVYMGRYWDETAQLAQYVAAESHPFEAWGDASAQRDVYSIVQPTLRPLWQTKSLLEALMDWAPALGVSAGASNAYELVQNTWKDLQKKYNVGGDFLKFWEDNLQSGIFDPLEQKRQGSASARGFKSEAFRIVASGMKNAKPAANGEFTLALYHSVPMGDGSQANNALLQELPDPVTKNTWGNYLSMSPETAKHLGVEDGDFVNVSNGSSSVKMTAHRQPGLKAGVLAAALGYGRKFAGRVGNDVGVDLNAFVTLAGPGYNYVVEGIKVSKAGGKEHIPCTQGHHTLDGREIIFETTLEEYKQDPKSGIVRTTPDPISIWSKHEYPGYKWGMTVDLNSCTGCSACVVACSVENNVPAVGRDQVQNRREMQWIRIDRYYTGDTENPEVIFQPMLCQHCDNAPCETVCPVLATTHSSEGLNQMTYNRCVGTKYCANNCPYKVRRFNWFENNAPMNAGMEHPLPMMKNPEVTLRSRGVMEKCTFCAQRIETAKSDGKSQGRRVEDKDLRTACQDACPTDAIAFGDLNNPQSRVAKLRQDPRGFVSLEELNARPAITYLTKVRNRARAKFGPGEGEHGHHG